MIYPQTVVRSAKNKINTAINREQWYCIATLVYKMKINRQKEKPVSVVVHLYFNFLYCDPIKIRIDRPVTSLFDWFRPPVISGWLRDIAPAETNSKLVSFSREWLLAYLSYLFLVTSDKIAITTDAEVACNEYPLRSKAKLDFIVGTRWLNAGEKL